MVWYQVMRALGIFESVLQIRQKELDRYDGGDEVCFRCIKTLNAVVVCASLVACRQSVVCWVPSISCKVCPASTPPALFQTLFQTPQTAVAYQKGLSPHVSASV